MAGVRTDGDDVVVRVKVRRVNLASLERGEQLGVDALTGRPIMLRLAPLGDGVYGIEVETNATVAMSVPEAVAPERVD
jgi:hypothetical protein